MASEHDQDLWNGKRVLVTGACGTVGHELVRQVASRPVAEVLGIDNNESAIFLLSENFTSNDKVRFRLCDVRDSDHLVDAMRGIDIVLHAAGLKHVVLCEQSPGDAVQTNILGTQNIIRAANANRVDRVLFTSSDKAVNPTNVMGTSKLMAERLMTSANAYRRTGGPIFASTRFGNVLGSRGSVVPIFHGQIARKGPVTLTDVGMTRFIMTLEDAVRLVMDSVFLACGGEVFVTKMPAIRIVDLAHAMIEELAPRYGHEPADVEVALIGVKPGEKLYEELMNEEEIRRTVELASYFAVLPAFKSVYESIEYRYPGGGEMGVERPYNSALERAMGSVELKEYLLRNGVLSMEGSGCES